MPVPSFLTRSIMAGIVAIAASLFNLRLSAQAVQLADGSTSFVEMPNLVAAESSQAASSISATYSFTIHVPDNAGEPLQAIQISQGGNVEMVRFGAIHAYAGDRSEGIPLGLASVGGDSSTQSTVVAFDPPIQPGRTVTVTIDTQTPPDGGVYEYGVTAYPAGDKSIGQFLGFGRFSFVSNEQ